MSASDADTAATRLQAHANDLSAGTLASLRWPSPSTEPSELSRAVDDVIDALGVLNRAINGELPSSESVAKAVAIDRRTAYAVAEIVEILREVGDTTNSEGWRDGALRVETAWIAVLAGDIDDLQEHIETEVQARAV